MCGRIKKGDIYQKKKKLKIIHVSKKEKRGQLAAILVFRKIDITSPYIASFRFARTVLHKRLQYYGLMIALYPKIVGK